MMLPLQIYVLFSIFTIGTAFNSELAGKSFRTVVRSHGIKLDMVDINLFGPKKFFSAVASTAVALSLITIPGSSAFATEPSLLPEVWSLVNENFVDSTYNGNDWNQIKEEYTKKLNSGNEQELTKKMLSKLGDKYTRLIDKKYFESLWKYDAIGIGLIFQSFPGSPMLVSAPPIDGSSSQAAGFKKGDFIYEINGRPTEKMTAMDVLDMMSNDDNDIVSLTYSHGNNDEKKQIELKRSKQKAVNPVSYFSQKMPDGKTAGYIRLKEFNSDAVSELKNAISSLENEEGVDEYVLDLRGNTGGGFQFALNIGGLFMDNKPMVTALGKLDDKSVFKSSYPSGVVTNKPLVLWVDGLSASASEVLAGGLHDNCRAVLVGAKTFGKGKIQAVFGLADGEGLTLTVAQYITPRGTVIQSKGLQPDIPLPTVSPYLKLIVDPVLSKPDISTIDFAKAKSILNMCVRENNNNEI
eukprot:gene10940-22838_t